MFRLSLDVTKQAGRVHDRNAKISQKNNIASDSSTNAPTIRPNLIVRSATIEQAKPPAIPDSAVRVRGSGLPLRAKRVVPLPDFAPDREFVPRT